MSDPIKVVILGGGVAGLAAAYHLQQAGEIQVIILEKGESPGGLARTIRRDGFAFDLGVHGLIRSSKASEPIYRFAAETMAADRVSVSKSTAIYFRSRLINYPLGVRELFFSLSPLESLLSLRDFIAARFRLRFGKEHPGRSFRDWITATFGARLYQIYFGPYAEKTWGIKGEELDGDHLKRRVTTVGLRDVVRKAIRQLFRRRSGGGRERYSQQPLRFYYGRTGSRVLVDGLLRGLNPDQVEVKTGIEIDKIIRTGTRVKEILYQEGGRSRSESADFVISTIPVTYLSDYILGRGEPRRLSYRAMVLVNAALSYNPFPRQWIYFPGKEFLFNRINNYTNLSKSMSPPGTAAINLEVTCSPGDGVWEMPDQEITELVLRQAAGAGFLDLSRVISTFTVRLEHAYPIYRVETARVLSDLKKAVATDNLLLAGRQANFSYINMDEAILEGHRAAAAVTEEAMKNGTGL